MTSIYNSYSCCGMVELAGLIGPIDVLKQMVEKRLAGSELLSDEYVISDSTLEVINDYMEFGLVLFTDRVGIDYSDEMDEDGEYGGREVTYGDMLRDYIINNKLGTITETPETHNPNSGNDIKAYVWAVDHMALYKWYWKNK